MSGAYLQRLFDRAAAQAAPLVAPTGPSRSPVAEADQRLNEPGLAELFSFSPAPDGGAPEAFEDPQADFAIPSPRPHATTPRTSPRPQAAPEATPPSQPDLAGERKAPPPAAPPPQPPPFAPVGLVTPEDFVPPEPVEAAAPETRRAAPPAPPEPAPSPEAAAPAMERVVEVRGVEAAPARPPEARAEPRPAARVEWVEAPQQPEHPPAALEPMSEATPEPQAQRPTLVTPPRPDAHATPHPVPDPEPAAEARQAAPSPRLRETVREVIREEAAAQDRPAPRRPMTAAEASLIGPLTPEPRARTLFGLRRR